MRPPRFLITLLTVCLLAASACADETPSTAKDETRAERKARTKKERSGRKGDPLPSKPDTCKEPAALDPRLAAGLAHYGASRWEEAATDLAAWAATPGAESDPAAARGLYALGYATRTLGRASESDAALTRALPLLEARITATPPTLEAFYYLQALHQLRGNAAPQLQTISQALAAHDAGTLCPVTDGDDAFRLARLYEFAGRRADQQKMLDASALAFASNPASATSPYRSLAERELGLLAFRDERWVEASQHLSSALQLDRSATGVARPLGIALSRQGKYAEAQALWRSTWRTQGADSNAIIYVLPVLKTLVQHAGTPVAAAGIANMAEYTVPAIEQNMTLEAKTYLALEGQRGALPPGQSLSAADALARDVAAYRAAQLALEYFLRGQDLSEHAVREGILPAIHQRDLPR